MKAIAELIAQKKCINLCKGKKYAARYYKQRFEHKLLKGGQA
jgi:hypothetical protein